MAVSTFRNQNVQNTPCSDPFWRFRCRFAWQVQGIVHLVKSEQNVRVVSHFQLQPPLHHTTLQHHYTTLQLQLHLHYIPLHYTTTLHYTQLHSITLHYTTLHSTTQHYTTLTTPTATATTTTTTILHLHYATLHYTNYTTLH